MKTRVIMAIIFVSLGLIVAFVPENTTHAYKLEADEMLELVYERAQFYSPDEIADMIVNKDPELQLIDVRKEDEYEKFSLPGAINIPITDLLSDEWRDYLDQDVKINVFYSNGTVLANEAWMITRQLGFRNNYVMEGGLNYWTEVISNPSRPKNVSPNEEFAKYDFRKGANQALGGGAVVSATDENFQQATEKPVIKARPKKKRVAGGC